MRRRSLLFCLLPIAVTAIAGCDQVTSFFPAAPAKPKGTIIAQVDNNFFITQEQLDKEIENVNALNALYFNTEAKNLTKEEKVAFLQENVIPKYLMFKEARAKKLENQQAIKEALFNYKVQLLSEEYLKRETGNIVASPQEIEGFYNTYKDRFRQDEERRIREIRVSSESEAKDILIELLKGADFAVTAQARSNSESAGNGGDLGYIRKGQLGEDYAKFDEVAFSLDQGQVSSVFKDKKGYYVVRVEDIKGGQLTPLNEAWDQVKSTVIYLKQQEKIQELRDALAKKAKITIQQDKIK